MEHLNFSEVMTVLRELEESAKCCVCIEMLRPPVNICNNGHAICSGCKGNMISCPTCKGKFSNMIPVVLNNILSALPKLCYNSSRGCSRLLTKLTQSEHEDVCPMRMEPCRLDDCTWSGSVSSLLNHIEIEHEDQPVYLEKNSCFWEKPELNEYSCDISFVHAFGCLFWKYECINVRKYKLLIFVQCLPVGDDNKKDFYSVISFSKKDSPLTFAFSQKCVYKNVVVEEIFELEKCMAIPLDMIPAFIDNDGKLNYSFQIHPLVK